MRWADVRQTIPLAAVHAIAEAEAAAAPGFALPDTVSEESAMLTAPATDAESTSSAAIALRSARRCPTQGVLLVYWPAHFVRPRPTADGVALLATRPSCA